MTYLLALLLKLVCQNLYEQVMLCDYFQFSHRKRAKLCKQLIGCALWILNAFYMYFFSKTRYLCFYLHYKLNFNNNSEKMYKFTIDWSTIMIISKTFEKIQIIWFMYKEFDDRKGISVLFNCNSTILPMNACHERTSQYILPVHHIKLIF